MQIMAKSIGMSVPRIQLSNEDFEIGKQQGFVVTRFFHRKSMLVVIQVVDSKVVDDLLGAYRLLAMISHQRGIS